MSKIRINPKEIEIHRNPVERILMSLRDSISSRKRVALTVAGFTAALIVVVIGAAVIYVNAAEANQRHYEMIMDNLINDVSAENSDKVQNSIRDLKEFIDTSFAGKSVNLARYTLGNLYYDTGDYSSAEKYLISFSEGSSSGQIALLALNKAALAVEASGDLKRALSMHKEIKEDHENSLIPDQTLYHLARLSLLLSDHKGAMVYYRQLIAAYPRSSYVTGARKLIIAEPLTHKQK